MRRCAPLLRARWPTAPAGLRATASFPSDANPPANPVEARTVFDDKPGVPADVARQAESDAADVARAMVTAETTAALISQGFAVTNLLEAGGPRMAGVLERLRDDIDLLHERGATHENATHLKGAESEAAHLVAKHGVYEAEASGVRVRELAPFLHQFARGAHALNTHAAVHAPALHLLPRGVSAKVQRTAAPSANAPAQGHHFPLHFDSAEGVDSRTVTCLVYLSDSDKSVQGGELVLFPFPQQEEPVTISPSIGTAVLFSSRRMLHATQPIRAGVRRLLTFWLWARESNHSVPRSPPPPPPNDIEATKAFLTHPALYRHMLKLHFGDRWRSSLSTAHADAGALLEMHDREVAMLDRVLGGYRGAFAEMRGASVPWF